MHNDIQKNEVTNQTLKELTHLIDNCIQEINKEGTFWFAFTINLYENNNLNKTKSEKINKWTKTVKEIEIIIQKNIIPWLYTISVMEFSKNDNLHIHGIIIIKNLTNYHKNIKDNLTELLKNDFNDVKIDFLKETINKKRWWMYILKELKQNNENYRININYNIKKQQPIAYLLDFLECVYDEYDLGRYGHTVYLHDDAFIKNNPIKVELYKKLENMIGIENTIAKTDKEEINDMIINLFCYFIQLNEIKWSNEIFLKKINKTLISYEIWCQNKNLMSKFEEVFSYYLQFLSIYVNNLNMYELKKHMLFNTNIHEKLHKIAVLLDIEIKLNFNYIEFSDGIFHMTTNKFIKSNKLKNLHTIKYFDKTYKHLKLPYKWLKLILEVMDYDKIEIDKLLLHLATIFIQNNEILKKKKVLFIVGKSNTYKTTLIANTMINFFGIENIALITKSTNFPFQAFENKTVGIFDEFVYVESLHEEYLKLFEGRKIIIEKKFKEPVVIDPLNIIIISNENFLESKINQEKKKALENRINTITFKKGHFEEKTTENIKNALEKEEAEIILFLVKYYYETINNKQKKWKKKFDVLSNENNKKLIQQ